MFDSEAGSPRWDRDTEDGAGVVVRKEARLCPESLDFILGLGLGKGQRSADFRFAFLKDHSGSCVNTEL